MYVVKLAQSGEFKDATSIHRWTEREFAIAATTGPSRVLFSRHRFHQRRQTLNGGHVFLRSPGRDRFTSAQPAGVCGQRRSAVGCQSRPVRKDRGGDERRQSAEPPGGLGSICRLPG
jgi:hypothetical protein